MSKQIVFESTAPAPDKNGKKMQYTRIYKLGTNEYKRKKKQMIADLMRTMSRKDAERIARESMRTAMEQNPELLEKLEVVAKRDLRIVK